MLNMNCEERGDPQPSGSTTLPERRLMAAILVDAMGVLNAPAIRPRDRRLQQETWNWAMADDPAWPFSFRNVCEILGFDPHAVRRRLCFSDRVTHERRLPALRPTIRHQPAFRLVG